jgi:uncharacterized membrane protein YccC
MWNPAEAEREARRNGSLYGKSEPRLHLFILGLLIGIIIGIILSLIVVPEMVW